MKQITFLLLCVFLSSCNTNTTLDNKKIQYEELNKLVASKSSTSGAYIKDYEKVLSDLISIGDSIFVMPTKIFSKNVYGVKMQQEIIGYSYLPSTGEKSIDYQKRELIENHARFHKLETMEYVAMLAIKDERLQKYIDNYVDSFNNSTSQKTK